MSNFSTNPKEEEHYSSSESFGNQTHHLVLRPSQADYDHILAERRKKQKKLNQRFIALTDLLPGLKKMDKASVLGDAIEYMKQLQDKVKILEEKTKKRNNMESSVFPVKKHDELVYSDESIDSITNPVITEQIPEIEARSCHENVLVRIHCEKREGVLEKTFAEIEKFNLSVVKRSVLTFGDSFLNITFIAKKNEECSLNLEELVEDLYDVVK
ncbi:hypothetical protein RD792_003125, partial [Penstemon davidsonii]